MLGLTLIEMGHFTTRVVLVPDYECKQTPGEDDFYLTWTNFSVFNL